ncbi:hypothetical protein SAMN06265365_15312 [Tistlia consotensis]|uniref:DUF2274 domain-containing protein n=1 Tax=Tistlia consotensis USBA 355 TaxID=560819 RepID=A0A1Y6CWU7_9PROT|nr:DUF2274 domain-containing protein [Tistlia consotensis]SMF84133.1 hypothetical protein SAMN05428998_1539 [Tistlia consotensis USBA 355]SNS35873.1 hypothetical protein SAMN06265365_15312 [Tistlia consotensis]
MSLKISIVPDDKPVRVTVELPAGVHRDLVAYGEALQRQAGQAVDPSKLIAPMLARFMATDRGFAKAKRGGEAPVKVRGAQAG